MDTIGLNYYVRYGWPTHFHEEVMKVDANLVHAGLKLKRVNAPGPQHHVAVDHDPWRAGVKKN